MPKILLHPLPIRIFHWVMAVCITILVLTGILFSTGYDWLKLPFRFVRLLHGAAGVILTVNVVLHIGYYLVTRRYRQIVLNRDDISNLGAFLRYYFYLRPNHPNFGHYNPGQKLMYDSWALVSLVAAVASLILLFPAETSILQRWLGSLQTIRVVKFGVLIWFLVTIPWHLYLVFTEDPAKLQSMFTGYVLKKKTAPSKLSTVGKQLR